MDGHTKRRIPIVILYLNLEEMQNYANFEKSIRDFLLLNPSPNDTAAVLQGLQKQVLEICSSFGSKPEEN